MQPPKAEPLQIPSEDDVPLFDPSGLSASLSVDDWHNSFDLNSVAAARLGIGSPPSIHASASASLSNSASIANLTRSDSRNNSNSDTGRTSSHPPPPPPQHDSDQHADSIDDQYDPRRGRRRRSSAAQSDLHPSSSTAVSSAVLPQKDTSVGSKVRMWWERSEAATPDADVNPASTAKQVAGPDSLPPLRTDMGPAESSSAANSTFASPTVFSPDSSSSVVRSPAADFLSAFSSLNSVVQPANSYDARSLSYSPPRAGHRSLGASLMRDEVRNGSAAAPGFASLRGLGSAAAMLYDTQTTTAPNPPPRCDDEGARVGPGGRYLLGKTIGFGGFSTVREGWDLDAQGPPDPTAPLIDGQRKGRRVAVKIVYHDSQQGSPAREATATKQPHAQSQSHELNIWKSLPVHPHLLPLLHHECLPIDAHHASPTHASGGTLAELLIMPYCDQGNLLDFVRSEGAVGTAPYVPNGEQIQASEDRRSGSGSWFASGSARSSMQLSRSSSLKASMDDPAWRQSGSRTGSGFMLPRNLGSHALGRVASVSAASQLRTIPAGQEPSSSLASSPVSAAGSASSGSRLIRRTTSRTSRSQGIPIDAARETMRQLASALSALHTKSHVLHGDLKLENVLGQDQSSWKKRQRMSTQQSDGDQTRSRQNSAGLADSIDSLAASSVSSRHTFDVTDAVMPCWRLADFGLAQVVDPAHAKSAMPAAPALIRALKEEAKAAHEPKGARNAQRTGRGGSLAYTAPEYLRAQGRSGSSSPRTPDDVADDDELPPESPFAADMWALGCILYALLSGKLPFSDSFEPRLQMKIAKAQWELPPRLRRRAERLAAASTSTLVSQPSVSNRNSLVDRAGSVEPASVADRFAFSQRRSASGAPHGPSSLGTMDLSASLPSLLPRERQATEPATSALSRRMVAVHSDHVVGSAPGRADHVESFEINSVAKARADVEEDPESDDDSDVDPAWNGLSWDRAAARQVLRGLLEPDPRRRWTIDRLCASAWIRQEAGESGNLAAMGPPASLLNTASALRSAHSTSTATAAGAADGAPSGFAERSAWANSASKSNPSLAETASQSPAAPSFDRANVDEQFQRTERGRRSSSLARTRPEKLATGGSGSASPALSPSISADDGAGAGAQRRSRSTSRISVVHRDSSRTRSTDVSGSSTPNRERDPAWMAHHLGSSLNSLSHAWVHSASKERCDSPAESERRGRLPRSRMADLDENTTWNGEDDTSSDSRAGSHVAGSLHRTGPIAIRGRSGSRSRSRHSGESGSPERFAHHRSISRSRSNYSLSHEAGAPGSLLYGRSVEPQPTVAPILADHTQAQRSSTARSRSRAPDALAQILGRQRSRSRSRMRDGSANTAPGVPPVGAAGVAVRKSAATPSDSEHEQEARGRARDRR